MESSDSRHRKAKSYLHEHDRVSLRGLKREFALDDDALEELVDELARGHYAG